MKNHLFLMVFEGPRGRQGRSQGAGEYQPPPNRLDGMVLFLKSGPVAWAVCWVLFWGPSGGPWNPSFPLQNRHSELLVPWVAFLVPTGGPLAPLGSPLVPLWSPCGLYWDTCGLTVATIGVSLVPL